MSAKSVRLGADCDGVFNRAPNMHRLEAHGRRPAGKCLNRPLVEDLNTKGSADKPDRSRARKAGLERNIPGTDWRSPRRNLRLQGRKRDGGHCRACAFHNGA